MRAGYTTKSSFLHVTKMEEVPSCFRTLVSPFVVIRGYRTLFNCAPFRTIFDRFFLKKWL